MSWWKNSTAVSNMKNEDKKHCNLLTMDQDYISEMYLTTQEC